MAKAIAASAITAFLSGCGGSLYVADQAWDKQPGIPFRATEVYVMRGMMNKHTEGKECDDTPFVRTVPLPAGAQYFIGFEGAMFDKSEFSVNFGDSGTLSSVSLNTEPGAAETLKATADVMKYALPVAVAAVGLGPMVPMLANSTFTKEEQEQIRRGLKGLKESPQPQVAEEAVAPPKVACNSGEDQVTLLPLAADLAKYR